MKPTKNPSKTSLHSKPAAAAAAPSTKPAQLQPAPVKSLIFATASASKLATKIAPVAKPIPAPTPAAAPVSKAPSPVSAKSKATPPTATKAAPAAVVPTTKPRETEVKTAAVGATPAVVSKAEPRSTPVKSLAPAPPAATAPAPALAAAPVVSTAAPTRARGATARKAPPVVTTIEVRFDVGLGNQLYLRGEGAGLSWDAGLAMECLAGDLWVWSTELPAENVVFKVLINDMGWSAGENFATRAGERARVYPGF